MPLRLIRRLSREFPKIAFKEFDPNENLEKEGRDLNIIDTVEGIRQGHPDNGHRHRYRHASSTRCTTSTWATA